MPILMSVRNMALAAGALALILTGAWINGMRWELRYNRALTAHQSDLTLIANAAAAQLRVQQDKRLALEQRLDTLDGKEHKELTDAKAENDRLRRLYAGADAERKRLRIEVILAANDRVVSGTAGPGSVVDGTSVELSERAGSAVWDIRAGMISDRAKLAYLQGYVCELRPDLEVCK
ncbi:MAG TPA: lysis system i-spanin subunit Rz [Pseudomonas sp.]|nr:lysis system i-spanin subunit Rz [Pseudomonas sp.]